MDHKKSKMKKKPKFKRQRLILKKLKNKWRRPKGLHSKLRLKKGGKGKKPNIGYGNDKRVRGMIKNQRPVYISNLKDVDGADKSIIISSKIGLKKKLEIINKAKEMNLQILNIRDVDKFLDDVKKNKESKIKEKEIEKDRKNKKIKKELHKEETKEEREGKLKEERKKVLEKGL